MDNPEVGDQVSWNWNGAQPGGQVSEKKTKGEVSVKSKRGNQIKKQAKSGDPAIALDRPGNPVVKNASEVQVDEKNSGGNNNDGDADGEIDEEVAPQQDEKPKKKKGRPPGSGAGANKKKADQNKEAPANGVSKRRGRPKGALGKKARKTKPKTPYIGPNGERRGRGRPRKTPKEDGA